MISSSSKTPGGDLLARLCLCMTLRPFHTVSSPFWTCFVPNAPQSKAGPGVVTDVKRGVSWLKAEIASSPLPTHSMLALDMRIFGYKTCITNIYLHGTTATEGIDDITNQPFDLITPTIIAGNFNLHHELWSPADYDIPSASVNAQTLADWIESHDINLENISKVITCPGKTRQRDLIINLTLTNHAAWSKELVSKWQCNPTLAYGSDHNGIYFDILIPDEHKTICETTEWRYVIDIENESEWLDAFEERIQIAPPPTKYNTEKDCQDGALAILSAMSLSTQKSMN
ncbi:hypothetical protein FRC10_012103 [Ceratobasidium sp. 414]|nr:hypothetical protein FRC10_012103 [Ceratobasidium sp. 414]